MDVLVKTVGRSQDCDFVVYDPKNRVSRKHVRIRRINKETFELSDAGSSNGTYVNGRRIPANDWIKVGLADHITLSSDYELHLQEVFPDQSMIDPDLTRVLPKGKSNRGTDEATRVVFQGKSKTYAFDADKTSLSQMSEMDETPFKTIGRDATNDIVLQQGNISRNHCRIRMLDRLMIQVVDLGSTNGTFADGTKLEPNKSYTFKSSVTLQLGSQCKLNLKKIFPALEIPSAPPPQTPPSPAGKMVPGGAPAPLTDAERKAFEELELLWKEYQDRQNRAANASMGYMVGGSVVGSVLGLALSPVSLGLSALATAGVTVLGRYLSMQKSNEIRNDFSYEDAFLEAYACPRCQESFQKKPWITIRECIKCRVKFK